MAFLPKMKGLDREIDLKRLRRALELAEMGRGKVSPGPLVGSVITDTSGEIVGEGSYFYKDVVHAEVVALREAGEKATGGTAYISLEPHVHHGKTPPCTEALLKAGIKRVVAPIEDPNPLVSGKGFEFLRDHGVEVETGLLAEEALTQNEAFVVWHREKRPFVHLKLAVSLDGKIATNSGNSKWITGEESRARVQALRHQADGILVGIGTVIADDPSLTDRSGEERVRDLVRIVLDSNLRTPRSAKVTDGTNPTIFFNGRGDSGFNSFDGKAEVVGVDPRNIEAVLSNLYEREIQSVLVEGGGDISAAFIESGKVDRVTFFVAPLIIGGTNAVDAVGGQGIDRLTDALKLTEVEVTRHGDDLEVTGIPARN